MNTMSVTVLPEADIPVKSLDCVIIDLALQRNHVHRDLDWKFVASNFKG